MKEWRRLDTEFDEQRRKAVRQPLAPICQLRQRISVSGDWDRRAGIADFRARAEEAHETERDAAERLAEIMPTTVAGATALLVHVLDEALDEVCGDLNPTDQAIRWSGVCFGSEQKNAKIRPPLGITTKSDFVFAQPGSA